MSKARETLAANTGIDPDDPQIKHLLKRFVKLELAILLEYHYRMLDKDLAREVHDLQRQLKEQQLVADANARNYTRAREREQMWREAHQQLASVAVGRPPVSNPRYADECACGGTGKLHG